MAPLCSSRCSSSSLNNKTPPTDISKYEKKEIQENLIYPKVFNANENKLANMYLKKIEIDVQQNFLDETAAQIKQRSKTNNPIRNPIGFLAWLCNEHEKGNTYLTSAYLKYQEQRARKEARERNIKQQQREITQAALNGERIDAVMEERAKRNKITPDKPSNEAGDRWGGINDAVRPKQNRE